MSDLEARLRKLEERLVLVPTVDDYLDASNRQRVRGLHALAERLKKHGFDGDYLFVEANRRMLAEDTPESRERDRETEVEGAREKLLARLEARSR